MPAKKYRKQAENVDAIQYDGTNQQEIIALSNGKVTATEDGGIQLDMFGNMNPINETEWIYVDQWGNTFIMSDANFQITYAPGPQETVSE